VPRPAKGARLHKFAHREVWYIRDTGRPDTSTGCSSREEAEKVLAAYIATKGRTGAANEPSAVTIDEVLKIYAEEYAHTTADPDRIGYAIEALSPFWSQLKVNHIKGETCRRYAKTRKRVTARGENGEPTAWTPISAGTIRRELGTLQAALNYAHAEGYLTTVPTVTLPEKPNAKERWLTRSEAARLIWAVYRGHKAKHLARFILISLYTGTRKDAVLRMRFEANTIGGWFDLDAGIMYRMGGDERATNKRRTPAPIPSHLAAHLRRWRDNGATWAVEYNGGAVADVKVGFMRACRAAKLEGVTPHTLKHTAITWALQAGVSTWDAAGFFATSEDTIRKVYGHHSPDHMRSALEAIERRGR
jgi:integrase